MDKTGPIIVDKFTIQERELKAVTGRVDFSELNYHETSPTLTLRLYKQDKTFWLRGEHRLDVGEMVRIMYDQRTGSDPKSPSEVHALEVLTQEGDVKYRILTHREH